jgi:hypothetical protein
MKMMTLTRGLHGPGRAWFSPRKKRAGPGLAWPGRPDCTGPGRADDRTYENGPGLKKWARAGLR